jgi:hypothetical protein
MNLDKQLSFKVDDEYSRTAFVIADHVRIALSFILWQSE